MMKNSNKRYDAKDMVRVIMADEYISYILWFSISLMELLENFVSSAGIN